MKTIFHFGIAAAVALALVANLHSQAPAVPKTPAQQLQTIKAKNLEIIEKQTATLLKLEQLEKDSEQIKAFGKRT